MTTRPASALAILATLLLVALPVRAQADDGVPPSAEAWYLTLPTDGLPPTPDLCDLVPIPLPIPLPLCGENPLGQLPTRPNPYPEQTLHVGVTAGLEDATTFLELFTPESGGATPTGGTLTLPVASADAGTNRPEVARFRACAVTGFVVDGIEAGDPDRRPAVDCATNSDAVFVPPAEGEGDAGVFTVDLAPFAEIFGVTTPAVALVPTEAALQEADTWHVAFDGRTREGDSVRPIGFVLSTSDTTRPSPTPAPEPTPTPDPAPVATPPDPTPESPGGVGPPTVPSPPRTPPTIDLQPPAPPTPDPPSVAPEAPTVDDAPPPEPPPAVALEPTVVRMPVGLAYPAVYAVPLLALAVAGMAGRSLVRPLRLPEPPDPS